MIAIVRLVYTSDFKVERVNVLRFLQASDVMITETDSLNWFHFQNGPWFFRDKYFEETAPGTTIAVKTAVDWVSL